MEVDSLARAHNGARELSVKLAMVLLLACAMALCLILATVSYRGPKSLLQRRCGAVMTRAICRQNERTYSLSGQG